MALRPSGSFARMCGAGVSIRYSRKVARRLRSGYPPVIRRPFVRGVRANAGRRRGVASTVVDMHAAHHDDDPPTILT
jgi:hypothetical protein